MASERDEAELGERAAKALELENASKAHTHAVISGRVIKGELRQRPQDKADRRAARGRG